MDPAFPYEAGDHAPAAIGTVTLSDCTHETHFTTACFPLGVLQMAETPFPTTVCVCSSDRRAAQTKNATGHDGVAFKAGGIRRLDLDPDPSCSLWTFGKLLLLLLGFLLLQFLLLLLLLC